MLFYVPTIGDANRIKCSLTPVFDVDAPIGRFRGIAEEIDE